MIWGSIPRGEEQRLYGDVQPPPAEQSPVPESQGPAVTNAVLAGGLGLHPKGPVPYQPGKLSALENRRGEAVYCEECNYLYRRAGCPDIVF